MVIKLKRNFINGRRYSYRKCLFSFKLPINHLWQYSCDLIQKVMRRSKQNLARSEEMRSGIIQASRSDRKLISNSSTVPLPAVRAKAYSSPYAQLHLLKPLVITDDMQKRQLDRKKARLKISDRAKMKVTELMDRVRVTSSDTITIGEGRIQGLIKSNATEGIGTKQRTFISDIENDDHSEHSASVTSTIGSCGTLGSIGGYSIGSIYSRTSFGTVGRRGEPSLRSIVSDIENRARNHMEPLDYVPKLCNLPLSLLSWNPHRAAKAERKRANHLLINSNPKIDIIGMHQPVELILARAYDRSSKLQNVLSSKQEHIENDRKHLIDSINHKMTRTERYAIALRLRQMQAAWLKALIIMRYNALLREKFEKDRAEALTKKSEFSAAMTLIRVLSKIVQRKVRARFQQAFLKKARKSIWVLAMGIKIFRKKIATKKIEDFLKSFKGNYRIRTVVHRFVASAHLIQRIGKDFIQINKNRLHVMCKIWDDLEIKFIIKKLEERKKMENNAIGNKKSNISSLNIDTKTRIEMEKQAEKWKSLDHKMEKGLQRHRLDGILPNAESLRDIAMTMTLSGDVKRRCLEKYIAMRRKAFVLLRDEIRIIRQKQMESFSKSDAHDLLKGKTEKINNTIKVKFQAGFSMLESTNIFLLFKGVDKHGLLTMIEMVHDAVGTFAIKIRPKKAPGRRSVVDAHTCNAELDLSQIHPSILAARKLKEEKEKLLEFERINSAINAGVKFAVTLEKPKLIIHQGQNKRRGGVQLISVL